MLRLCYFYLNIGGEGEMKGMKGMKEMKEMKIMKGMNAFRRNASSVENRSTCYLCIPEECYKKIKL